MAKKIYRVNPRKALRGAAFTILDGEHINLAGGDVTIDLPGSAKGSPKQRKYRGAKQGDLKKYYENSLVNGKPTQTLVTEHDASSKKSDEVIDDSDDASDSTDNSSSGL